MVDLLSDFDYRFDELTSQLQRKKRPCFDQGLFLLNYMQLRRKFKFISGL